MKVCITGSAGFIGSNLTEACLRKGWEVVGIDNFATGHKEMVDPRRFINIPGKYSFVEMDINETIDLSLVMPENCDVVFHLAALARVPFSIDHPLEANQANATGHLSVLEAARKAGVKRVIFACSSSIFGGAEVWPTPEDTRPKPLSPYALQKHYGAELNRLYSDLHGLETVSLVYYNIFGPYQRTGGAYSTVIPAFFEAAMKGGSCRIDGSGMQSRDFTYVDDIVNANILAAEYQGKLLGELFNVANQESHSVMEVYSTINNFVGGGLDKHFESPRPGDPMKSMADITKAKKVLGYKPSVGFKEGMKRTYEWWKSGCPTYIKK